MKDLNKFTTLTSYERKKTIENFFYYQTSTHENLRDIYESFSTKKQQAFDDCKKLRLQFDGNNLKIIRFNRNVFTAGFTFENNNERYFMYITPSFNAAMKINDILDKA